MVSLARTIRNRRADLGLSQAALADRTGLADNTISLIELGKTTASILTLARLEQGLELPNGALRELSESEQADSTESGSVRPDPITHPASVQSKPAPTGDSREVA